MKQNQLFKVNGGKVVINNFSEPGESKTSPATVKLTQSEKEAIQEFCFKHDMSVSEFMRMAANFFYDYYEHGEKLAKYKQSVFGMLDGLP